MRQQRANGSSVQYNYSPNGATVNSEFRGPGGQVTGRATHYAVQPGSWPGKQAAVPFAAGGGKPRRSAAKPAKKRAAGSGNKKAAAGKKKAVKRGVAKSAKK